MAGGLGGYGGKLGWSAGLASWLDSPNSKVNRYWREIEFGTRDNWSGRTIAGLWSDTLGNGPLGGERFSDDRSQKFKPAYKKGTPQTPEGMLGAARRALWTYMEGGKGRHMDRLKIDYVWVYKMEGAGKARHRVRGSGERRAPRTQAEYRRAQQSLFHWFMTKAESADEIPFVAGEIKRPIEARNYYAKAIADFKPRLIEMEREGMATAARWAIGNVKPGTEYSAFRTAAGEERGHKARTGRATKKGGYVPDAGMARFIPAGGAQVSFAASVQLQYSMRGGDGRFINGVFQSTLREVNARVADAYLREVAALMKTHRPSTGDLIAATVDHRNRYPNDRLAEGGGTLGD